jgi:hypothetical protein
MRDFLRSHIAAVKEAAVVESSDSRESPDSKYEFEMIIMAVQAAVLAAI